MSGWNTTTIICAALLSGAARGVAQTAGVPPGTLPADPDLYRRLAGSYQISPERVIDLGPHSESGGRLQFADSYTRRTGVLYATSDSTFFAGPLGVADPKELQIIFSRGPAGEITGLRLIEGESRRLEARRVAPYRENEIVFTNGDVTMYGTLTLPAGPGPYPVVVFAPGSMTGPPRPGGFFPYFMVRQGVGLLTIDKRGTGKSTGDWHTAGYDVLADDLIAAVSALAKRPDVDPRRIGIWGNSEGGWTAPLAASKSKEVAFVIIRSGSALPVADALAVEAETRLRDLQDGTTLSNLEIDSAVSFKRRIERMTLDPAPWPVIWPRIAAAYDSMRSRRWLKYVEGPPEHHWWWQWIRVRVGYDPAPALEKLTVPVLVLLGDKDCCMPRAAANAAAFREAFARAGNRRAEVYVLANGSHGLLEAETGYMSEGAKLKAHVPGYLDRIAVWVRVQVGKR